MIVAIGTKENVEINHPLNKNLRDALISIAVLKPSKDDLCGQRANYIARMALIENCYYFVERAILEIEKDGENK